MNNIFKIALNLFISGSTHQYHVKAVSVKSALFAFFSAVQVDSTDLYKGENCFHVYQRKKSCDSYLSSFHLKSW